MKSENYKIDPESSEKSFNNITVNKDINSS